jgi:replicative DNA helicase
MPSNEPIQTVTGAKTTAESTGTVSGADGDARSFQRKPQSRPTVSLVDRVLPHSMDAEVAVLGAMLLDVAAGAMVREKLTDENFYYAPHRVIFREIAGLQDELGAVDPLTLTQRLQDRRLLEQVGGAVYIADLFTRVPTAANVQHYIAIVKEKSLLRSLIGIGSDIVVRSYEEQDDVQTWLDEVEQQVFRVTADIEQKGAQPIRNLIKDAMTSIEQLYDNKGMTGLPTGFRDFDKMTSGLHPGNMFIVAARPSVGKTAFAMNIAEHVAVDLLKPVGVFSLEMASEELVKRMLCSRSRVNLRALRDGFLGEQHFHKLTTVASELMRAPLYIDDSANLSISQVRAKARRMKSQYDIQLIVIDYLQLMRAPSRRADQSRQVEIADISSGVKGLAKELQIPVIVLSQLNRQPEQREGGKPRLSDLRESGSIEQDADVVGLLVRPEMYAEDEQDRSDKEGEATLIIAKQRNGPTGDVPLTFMKEYTRFTDQARVGSEDMPAGDPS